MGDHCLGSPTGTGLQAVPSPVLTPVSPLGICTNSYQVSLVTIHSLGQQIFATCGSAHPQATQDRNRRESGRSQQGEATEEGPIILVLNH